MKKLFFLILLCFLANTSMASLANQEAISQFKTYLREITSIAVDFTQEDSHNNKVEGKLLINKPYKFRCNYYPPFPLVIIGNKNYVSIYDYDMQQVSRIKTAENIFNFLLEDKENFDKHFVFESAIDQGNIFKITIYHSLTERHSEITFNKSTKQIQMMKIFEDDNIITITFNKVVKVQKFDDDLFKLRSPDIFGPPERLDKPSIEKKYINVVS
ncbi:outer-membrane lipoprotein carrier protein LolA [Rickettsia endosymbiont of Halotydeus destructor]|uniref:outer-membrane lipoprotein carrier protein LolA n=1 Tax=Rickettsia endosymbiont of Halotydeus destructor TaxID=2996754 RepID=UPI003BB0FDED